MTKVTALLAVAGLWVGYGAAGAPAAPTNSGAAKSLDLFGDTVVAKGKGFEVKRGELDSAMVSIKGAAAVRGQSIPADQVMLLEQQVLERLIQVRLLLAKATEADKTAAKETAEKRMEAIKARAKTDEALNRQLKSMGTTQEDLRTKMIEELTAENVVERELKITVRDEEVKQFYDDNPARFEQPEMVRASHVLFGTKDSSTGKDLPDDKKAAKKKQAEEVLKRARAGEDFAKLAKEFSDDPGSKDSGGEYTFPRGQMVKEFEQSAFSLQTNQVSDLVTTEYGVHIIKLSEKIPAKMLELDKVAPDIKEFLKQREVQAHQKEFEQYMDKLKQDAGVTILDEKLKLREPTATATGAKPSGKADKK